MFNVNSNGLSGRWTSGLALVMALVSGCGGSGGGSSANNAGPNTAPAANLVLSGLVQAGGSASDVSASTSSELSLNGSTSTDPEGDTMTYKWSVTKPAASKLTLANATTATQAITPDVAGVYVVTLRVTDSKGAFTEKAITINVRDNVAPVTNVAVTASYNAVTTTMTTQGLNVGSAVVLNAQGSTDVDGDAVTTTWTLIDKPATSQTGLTVDGKISRFTADVEGTYQVRARGADAHGAYSDTIYVFSANNSAPKSVVVTSAIAPGAAGNSSMKAPAGYIVSLQSFAYSDASSTFAWELVSKPASSKAALTANSGANVQITPDRLGNYVVKVTETSANGTIASHLKTIEVTNSSPIAEIFSNATPTAVASGPAVRLATNSTVTLRSTNSVDADGDALTIAWTLVSKPTSSTAKVSAATGTSVQLTADLAGTYTVRMRATDPSGAFSEKLMTFQAGTYSPVAVIDKRYSTVLLGAAATATAGLSFDEDSGPLTYSWAIDAAPSGSTAAIAAPTAAAFSFTPDVAGHYVASVTVSDGVNTNVAYLTIRAVGSMVSNVELGFAPLDTRYSKGLDQLLILATNPNTLKIVDPFSGLIKTVLLPLAGTSLNLSPDGKLAVVLHDGIVTLVDVSTGTVVRSSSTINTYSEAIVSNEGILHLLGSATYSSENVRVMNGRTGVDLSANLSNSVSSSGAMRGIYSPVHSRIFTVAGNYGYGLSYFDIDASTGKVERRFSGAGSYNIGNKLFLSENEDLVFSSAGNYFRASSLELAGKLTFTGTIQSISNSSQMDETLMMVGTQSYNYPDYGTNYQASYKRYVGALFLPAADMPLPLINGSQSYGLQIYHSATGKHVALVQTMTAAPAGAGAKYYVVTR